MNYQDNNPLCAVVDPALWAFLKRVDAGGVTHEELADAFVQHLDAAKITSREETLARLYAKCPAQADLDAFLNGAVGRFLVTNLLVAAFSSTGKRND